MRSLRVPAPLTDAALVCLAALDLWFNLDGGSPLEVAYGALACSALVVRRRYPPALFVLGLPATLFFSLTLIPFVTLYTLAGRARSRLLLTVCALASAAANATPWPLAEYAEDGAARTFVDFVYLLATAAAPVFLGQLVQARGDVALRLAEVEESRDHERRLHAEQVLARERAQLSREMHDVVSHQVSLIAVRAGALQVSARERQAQEAARTIRELSVSTLDELRHMVTLLRLSGGTVTELTPQPTLADLHRLVEGSGIEACLEGGLPAGLPATVQRTLYRTVQEALTNVRKHAPGATAAILLWHDQDGLGVTVTNTSAPRPALPLPGSHHGLMGLRERADILRGTLESGPTADGGYELRLRLPRQAE
ncbi:MULTISPECIES: sensor histidine kinase [unclassified Streptomyces]|uniref:sensor histidine kinase n=1 Tax=unclassified Streptomyces TaxID=2593676 RepID=UPI00093E6130|nr:sensor histidine kinase [Streptomyces sp. TSRI0281]OKI41298.1 two-component sensor histidine kinase [Streptomyces sp. TSRI0281]